MKKTVLTLSAIAFLFLGYGQTEQEVAKVFTSDIRPNEKIVPEKIYTDTFEFVGVTAYDYYFFDLKKDNHEINMIFEDNEPDYYPGDLLEIQWKIDKKWLEGDKNRLPIFAVKTTNLSPAKVLHFTNNASKETPKERTKEIFILDKMVRLEISEGFDFHCIGMRLSDENLNLGEGTYMEIKKQGNFYFLNHQKDKKYSNMEDGIEDALKELFIDFYNRNHTKKQGKKVWSAFLKEGGLQQFIDFANEIIDENFLNSPFNEIYG